MPNYREYRQYQPRAKGLRIAKPVLMVIAFFFIYLIARAIFGGGKENDLNALNAEIANIAAQANGNVSNQNSNTPSATNAAGPNVNTQSGSGSTSFSVATHCTAARSRGSTDSANIALTFNVGTTKEGSIDTVLTALTTAGVSASFFVTGDVAEGNAALVKKISDQGFPVYSSGDSLTRFADLTDEQIAQQLASAEQTISVVTGATTKPFFRPPYGSIDEDSAAAVTAQGYCPVTWTVDALDWSSESTAASSTERVLSKAGNGGIILMQAGNSITAEIVPDVISGLKGKGLSFVDLGTLLAN